MGIARHIGRLQNRTAGGVGHAHSAIEHPADGVHAGRGEVVQKVAAPARSAGTDLFLGARGDCDGRELVVGVFVAGVVVEVAVVVDLVGLVAHVDHAVAVQVGGVVIGLVVELVVAAHHQHVQRRIALAHEQRCLCQGGVAAILRSRKMLTEQKGRGACQQADRMEEAKR